MWQPWQFIEWINQSVVGLFRWLFLIEIRCLYSASLLGQIDRNTNAQVLSQPRPNSGHGLVPISIPMWQPRQFIEWVNHWFVPLAFSNRSSILLKPHCCRLGQIDIFDSPQYCNLKLPPRSCCRDWISFLLARDWPRYCFCYLFVLYQMPKRVLKKDLILITCFRLHLSYKRLNYPPPPLQAWKNWLV